MALRSERFKDINMDTSEIEQLLGAENVPELNAGPLGRLRLVQALQTKFGADFRSVPAASKALQSFDSQTDSMRELLKLGGMIDGERI